MASLELGVVRQAVALLDVVCTEVETNSSSPGYTTWKSEHGERLRELADELRGLLVEIGMREHEARREARSG